MKQILLAHEHSVDWIVTRIYTLYHIRLNVLQGSICYPFTHRGDTWMGGALASIMELRPSCLIIHTPTQSRSQHATSHSPPDAFRGRASERDTSSLTVSAKLAAIGCRSTLKKHKTIIKNASGWSEGLQRFFNIVNVFLKKVPRLSHLSWRTSNTQLQAIQIVNVSFCLNEHLSTKSSKSTFHQNLIPREPEDCDSNLHPGSTSNSDLH